MTKKEIRKDLDGLFRQYLDYAIEALNEEYHKSIIESYIDKCKGIALCAESLGVISFDDWCNVNRMLIWFNSDVPIDERVYSY